MTTSNLCEFCSVIDFSLLRIPVVGDIRNGRGAEGFPLSGRSDAETYIAYDLGYLDRVIHSSPSCGFCFLVQEMLLTNTGKEQSWKEHDYKNMLLNVRINMCSFLRPAEGDSWEGVSDNHNASLRCIDIHYENTPGVVAQPGRTSRGGNGIYYAIRMGSTGFNGSYTYCQFDDMKLLPGQTLYGGRKVEPFIDLNLISNWVHNCLTTHGDACGVQETAQGPANDSSFVKIRLIDVCTKSVVALPISGANWPKYVALSYVWGGPQKLMLKTSNVATLQSAGALEGTVSKTIEDAIYLTRLLDIPYIWVDALCIVQDDDGDKAEQLGLMSTIYTKSLLTVVAATGTDAESGIPGLVIPRDITQRSADIIPPNGTEAVTLVGALSPRKDRFEHVLGHTKWSTRGWTMQEKAVPHRVLMLTDQLAYWACDKANWSEEIFMESGLAQTSWDFLQEADFTLTSQMRTFFAADESDEQVWYKLRRLAHDYTGRSLSVEGDALDAFSAVLQQVQNLTGEHFVWGVPATRFELALCWEAHREGIERRTCLTTLKTTSLQRRVAFPSWSWLGWKGVISLRVEDRLLEHGIEPEIICYVLRNCPPRLVRTSRISFDNKGLRLPPPPSQSPFAVSMNDILLQCPSWNEQRLQDTPDDQIVFFWTETAQFTIISRLLLNGMWASNNRGWYCHSICHADGKEVGQSVVHHASMNISDKKEVEFILLASNNPPAHASTKIVLQIERRDGIAYRVNIAEINAKEWAKAQPKRTLVALG